MEPPSSDGRAEPTASSDVLLGPFAEAVEAGSAVLAGDSHLVLQPLREQVLVLLQQ